MSPNKIIVRDYTFSDAKLKQSADNIANKVARDQAQFTLRGITPAVHTSFVGLITTFDNTSTDEELLGALSEATLAKDTLGENTRIALRTIRTMAMNKWTTSHPSYRTFAFDGMNDLSDAQLARMAKRALRKATDKLADLSSEGLTVAILASMEQTRADFDDAIDDVIDAADNRDEETQDRIVKGNALYKEMMRICNTGKDLFRSTDEAKYNDYIIYNTPSGEKPPPDPNTGYTARIVDEATGEPLANATVETNKKKYGTELTKSVKVTGNDGMAYFTELEVVEYIYTVTCENYVTKSGTIMIEAGVIKELTVRLVAR